MPANIDEPSPAHTIPDGFPPEGLAFLLSLQEQSLIKARMFHKHTATVREGLEARLQEAREHEAAMARFLATMEANVRELERLRAL